MFDKTVRQGIRFASWNTVPMRRSGAQTSSPPIRSSPADGSSKPSMRLRRELFPQPLGPHRETKLPAAIERSIASKATVRRRRSPNTLLTLRTSICATQKPHSTFITYGRLSTICIVHISCRPACVSSRRLHHLLASTCGLYPCGLASR